MISKGSGRAFVNGGSSSNSADPLSPKSAIHDYNIDAAKMLALDTATSQPGEAIEKLVNDALAEPVSSSRGRCTRMHSLAQSICLTNLCKFLMWRNGYVELRPRIRRALFFARNLHRRLFDRVVV